jgi:hypothetical protein
MRWATSAMASKVVGQDRVLVEEGVIGLDAAGEDDSLGRGQAAVDLDAQVHLIAHGLAVAPHRLDGVLHLGRMGLEIRAGRGARRERASGGPRR